MNKASTPTVQASGLFHRMFGGTVRAGSSLPKAMLALAVLLLAVAALGGVFSVAQAQEANGAISGLSADQRSPGALAASWNAPNPAPTDYPSWNDENETDRGNAYPAGDATSLTLSGLSEGTEFKVQVRSRYHDGAHQDSPWSGPWAAEVRALVMSQPAEDSSESGTRDSETPAAPTIGGAAVTPEGHVLLLWQDPSDDSITGYQVLRGPDADSLVVIEEDTGSSGTSYTDTSPPAGRTHTYAVKARNAAGLSPLSGTVTATVLAAEPEEEELITAQQSSDVVLVSNLGQTVGGRVDTTPGHAVAQAFVAGQGPVGFEYYRVQGIRVFASARGALARIHRRRALGTALEEARGCPHESGIMV